MVGGLFAQAVNSASLSDAVPAGGPPSPVFTFVAGGDLLGPYHSNLKLDDPAFAKVVKIVKSADAAFANEEGNTFELTKFAGWYGGVNMYAVLPHSLATTRAFKEMGFDLLARANNHATDWDVGGLFASDRALDSIGIVHAGTGRSLKSARAPGYFESPKGRVALISSASTFTPESAASDPSRGAGPRPGINPLHIQKVSLVTASEMSTLQQIERRGHWEASSSQSPDAQPPSPGYELMLGGYLRENIFRVSDQPGVSYNVSNKDRAEIIDSIGAARRSADFVVYSIHAHEGNSGSDFDPTPGDFLPPLFHDIVDAGADVVVRSGPHDLMGVEIYHGKPIFYGLGDLFFDLPPTWVVPYEGWDTMTAHLGPVDYDSALASSEFHNGVLSKITIYPLVADSDESSATHGVPRLAQGADAARILEKIQQRSVQFGTRVDIVDGVGVIKGPGAP
jgi:poly-gamma-glutamate capsule biosynthesis protein CapA/YwtB (metallophosphatase superfamily)